jgi:hypothetical protein
MSVGGVVLLVVVVPKADGRALGLGSIIVGPLNTPVFARHCFRMV